MQLRPRGLRRTKEVGVTESVPLMLTVPPEGVRHAPLLDHLVRPPPSLARVRSTAALTTTLSSLEVEASSSDQTASLNCQAASPGVH